MILIRCLMTFVIAISNCFAFETTADDVEIDTKEGVCVLSGNAVVKYDNKVFKADKITIYKKDSEKLPNKIIASGNVSYSDDKYSVTSQKCKGDANYVEFFQDVVIQNKDLGKIEADKARYDVKTKKIDLTSKKKVKLTLDKVVESKFDLTESCPAV